MSWFLGVVFPVDIWGCSLLQHGGAVPTNAPWTQRADLRLLDIHVFTFTITKGSAMLQTQDIFNDSIYFLLGLYEYLSCNLNSKYL